MNEYIYLSSIELGPFKKSFVMYYAITKNMDKWSIVA